MLRNLGMIGVSWRQSGKASLAEFTLDPATADVRLAAFAHQHGLSEVAYIATCNRVELVFVQGEDLPIVDLRPQVLQLLTGRDAPASEALRTLKAWGGEGAMEHLFMVAAGLDSAMLGEVEIAGQVRAGWDTSRRLGLCGPLLETLFEEALRVAGTVRGETRIATGRVSLAEIAVDLVKEQLRLGGGQVALIGVSPMTERAAVSLKAAGVPLLIVNRTRERAVQMAQAHAATACTLEDFALDPPPVVAMLSATGAMEPLFGKQQLERIAARAPLGGSPLVVDMAIPPDFDPESCRALDIPRVGMEEITRRAEQNRSARLLEAAQAREMVDEALIKTHERLAERYSGRLFGALQQRYRRTAEEGVKRLLRKDLAGLSPEQCAAVETWAAALARRFAHIPCLGLRGLLHDGPEGALEAFFGGLEPEFADELRAALDGSPPTRQDNHAA